MFFDNDYTSSCLQIMYKNTQKINMSQRWNQKNLKEISKTILVSCFKGQTKQNNIQRKCQGRERELENNEENQRKKRCAINSLCSLLNFQNIRLNNFSEVEIPMWGTLKEN